jgi:hypothetical protein
MDLSHAGQHRVNITDPMFARWQPVGEPGELCPSSRTSVTWSRQWPIKPDVVFEGGNYATDGVQAPQPIDDLRLLTTHWRTNVRLLTTMGDTSGAFPSGEGRLGKQRPMPEGLTFSRTKGRGGDDG